MEVNGVQYCFGCIDFHYMDKNVSVPGEDKLYRPEGWVND